MWDPLRLRTGTCYADAQLLFNRNLALLLGKDPQEGHETIQERRKQYKSIEDVDRAVPFKGFGAGIYEEEEERGNEVAKT